MVCSALSLGCQGDEAARGSLPDGQWLGEFAPNEVLSSEWCRSPHPGDSPLRRLSHAEYRNTLADLGVAREQVEEVTASFPSEPVSLGFRNGARALNVDTLMAQEYSRVARTLRERLVPDCDDDESETDCIRAFVVDLGKRLFRRPLTGAERDSLTKLYDEARNAGEERVQATAWIVEALLQSPDFLYRVEIPEPRVARVTGYEMASRLSYTLWQAPPDQELLTAASAGELETTAQVEAQARRLLRDAKALRVYEFFRQWLDLDELSVLERDKELYPNLPANLDQLLLTESEAFIKSLLRRGDADLRELLTAPYTYANRTLAEHYGLHGPTGTTFERVAATERSGILTQAMWAVQDGPTRTSIVRRGLKLRTDFLCQTVPAPPDDVDLTLDGIDEDISQAERLALHRQAPSCDVCHRLMDPLGVILEGFDAVGRKRTQDEHGTPIDTEGEVSRSLDLDGTYGSLADFADALSESREMEQCYLIQNFRFFQGRDVTRGDLCSQAQLTQHFRESGHNLVELLIGLVRSDAFLYKSGLTLDEVPGPAESPAPSGAAGAPTKGGS